MNVSSTIQKYVNIEESGICIEIGSNAEIGNENHLFDFEEMRWVTLCIQKERDAYESLRKHRRLCINRNCYDRGSEDFIGLDSVLERTNVDRVDLILLKGNAIAEDLISGFDLNRWRTNLISVSSNISRIAEFESKILPLGFSRVDVVDSEVFIFHRNLEGDTHTEIKDGLESVSIEEIFKI